MNEDALRELLQPLLESSGLELDNLVVIPAGRRSVLRITVDGEGPKGRGPLLDDIAAATRMISDALDDSTAVGNNPYTLEVSSRGTSTPLTEPKHYRRNRGRLVKLALVGGESLTARLLSADETGVQVEFTPERTKQVKHPQPETRGLSYDQITKAVIQVELNRPFDPELDDEPGADGDDSSETEEQED
ncbi:ribosome maturation factor RimP [Aestuariimicrobium sp. Y1814]|uniref:ribosome maturation factor RimP n=1 Tax=Aestuariimicrobium sp. Y1814 TaxID=3418742 RepID=UPI003DA6FFDB